MFWCYNITHVITCVSHIINYDYHWLSHIISYCVILSRNNVPPVISCFKTPMNTMVISIINHGEIRVTCTNLAIITGATHCRDFIKAILGKLWDLYGICVGFVWVFIDSLIDFNEIQLWFNGIENDVNRNEDLTIQHINCDWVVHRQK